MAKGDPKPSDVVTYVDESGARGLGQVLDVLSGGVTLRALNAAGQPVVTGVARDDAGGPGTWHPTTTEEAEASPDPRAQAPEGDGG